MKLCASVGHWKRKYWSVEEEMTMKIRKKIRLVNMSRIDWNGNEMKITLMLLSLLGFLVITFGTRSQMSSHSKAVTVSDRVPVLRPSELFAYSSASMLSLRWLEPRRKAVGEEQDGRVLRRLLHPHGSAAYVFVQMGAYRGGLDTFAVMGLSSKTLHVFGEPLIECEWVPAGAFAKTIRVNGTKMLPDWGYGRVYTTVVVNCTFPENVGINGLGGMLVLYAHHGDGGTAEDSTPPPVRIVALTEPAGSVNASKYTSPPELDYLYCGSPLYGNLSPQRVREWFAYHVRLFGKRSHFVIHDDGGVHPGVLRVLEPWVEAGYVTLQDVRAEERFDGYYHNQFLVVNDCLHRYRFAANWIFYFDLDEFLLVPQNDTLASVMSSLLPYTQFTIEQMPMSSKLCLLDDYRRVRRQWGLEKLVFKDVKTGIKRDRKYAIQARNVLAAGVHMSENLIGRTTHKTEGRIMYYHYHGSIARRREPCRTFINTTKLTYEGRPFVLDDTMRKLVSTIKGFETDMIGDRLSETLQ